MPLNSLPCPGMRADNPLGFMAAIGFLRAIDAEWPALAPKLAWQNGHAVFSTEAPGLPDDWAAQLAGSLKEQKSALLPDRPIIKTDIATFRREARARLATAHTTPTGWTRLAADLQAGLATDALPPEKGEDEVAITAWSFANGGSGKNLIKDLHTLINAADAKLMLRAMSGEYEAGSDEGLPSIRWEPGELREYAYRDTNPGDSKTASPCTPRLLQAFAAIGLSFLPTLSCHGRSATTGLVEIRIEREMTRTIRWPIWLTPMGVGEVQFAMMQFGDAKSSLGFSACFESRRMTVGKNNFFSPAVAVPLR